jgi:hypothetical protein
VGSRPAESGVGLDLELLHPPAESGGRIGTGQTGDTEDELAVEEEGLVAFAG